MGGTTASEGEREEARTGSGYNPGELWAGSRTGPNRSPAAFSYFLFFFLFSFSGFPYFFHIICKLDSNQVKPYSEIL
jgi:hypothetical protein